jgi:Flp pilus assembly protein TadG
LKSGGQSMIELAVCAPVVALLALGAAADAQVADARAGLDAATQAAAAAAARAPNASTARAAAQARFDVVVAAYPLTGCVLRMNLGSFGRNGLARAESSASIDLAWASLLPFQTRLVLEATAVTHLEPFRTHEPAP